MRSGQEAILAEMRRWGYRFVVTPTLESDGALSLGLGPEQRRRLFKFADADGSLLAIVGEKKSGARAVPPSPGTSPNGGPIGSNDPIARW